MASKPRIRPKPKPKPRWDIGTLSCFSAVLGPLLGSLAALRAGSLVVALLLLLVSWAALAAVILFIRPNWMPKRATQVVILSFAAVILAGLGYWEFHSFVPQPSAREIAEEVERLRQNPFAKNTKPGRRIIDETPEGMMKLVSGLTDVQANKLFEIYVGKWMRVSGQVAQISPLMRDKELLVVLRLRPQENDFAGLTFDADWKGSLEVLRQNQQISATCQLKALNAGSLSLEHCELNQ